MKRINVQVPDDVHTRAKVIAVLKETTLSEYLERAIVEAVERDKHVIARMRNE